MISIIICSKNPEYLRALTANIEETIGTVYEILAIENRFNPKGIAAVYNDVAAKAKYNIICFLHEDICLHTISWGQVLVNTLADENIGLVGISGSVYKSKYPGTWSACDSSLYRTHSIQHFRNASQPIETNINPFNEILAEVAVIDGVFMATTKSIFEQYQFDDKLLDGFHCYDLDYSMQVRQKFKVAVTYEILLEHFSEGNLNKAWLDTSLVLHKKWEANLPAITISLTDKYRKFNDYIAICSTLISAIRFKGYKKLVSRYYFLLTTSYYTFNKIKYTMQYAKYIFGLHN